MFDVFKNTILVVLSLMCCLVSLEFGLRLYSVFFFPKMMVLDDKLGWRHARSVERVFPNELGEKAVVVQNSFGNRGTEHGYQKTPGKCRILVVGDSFTEGVQVGEEDVFTRALERTDPTLEVINAGVGGYGTVQEYLYLRSEGLKFSPDVVLLMFFENDLTDNCLSYYPGFGPRPYAKLVNGEVRIVEHLDLSEYRKFALPAPFQWTLSQYSYSYYFLNSRIYQRLRSDQMRSLQQADMRRFGEEERYKIFFAVLEQIRGLLREKKIDFTLVLIPSREQARLGDLRTISPIINYCRGKGITYLPLCDRFRAKTNRGNTLYFPEDMHWTKEGHQAAAQELCNLSPCRRALSRPAD